MADLGTFIVIEGSDGSGKGTQFRLLKERLTAVGYDVEVFDFPQYDNASSYFVKEYLNGRYGPAGSISPYTASLFYALDRFEAAPKIRKALARGKIVLCNRYVGSNMAHQGGKFADSVEQRSFFVWEDSLEYQLLNIPRPKINVFLKVPAEIAQQLVAKKKARQYTDKSHDEHEADIEHLRQSVATYDLLCELFPNDFTKIDCAKDGQLLSIPEINNKIWQVVKPLLPSNPSGTAHSVVVRLNEEARPEDAKSSSQPDKPAEMPQLAEKLSLFAYYEALQAGLKLGAATKAWHKNNFEYYKPEGLPKKTLARYDEILADMISSYKAVRAKLGKTPDAGKYLLAMTPLAALIQTKAAVDPSSLPDVIRRLAASESKEIVELAEKLNALGRKADASHFKNEVILPAGKGPEPINKILARLAAEHLPQNLPQEVEPVVLIEDSPRNEFKVLADTIYAYSSLPKVEIEGEIDNWSYQQKSETLESAVRSGADDILSKFHYQFDVTADRLALEQLMSSGLAAGIKVQQATPRFGYDVPEEVEKAEVTDEFLASFDKSLELFSALQAAGREDLAAYATLAGHKTRFQLSCSLDNINSSLKSDNSAEVKKIINAMIEQIGERHPVAIASLVKAQVPPAREEKKTEPPVESKPKPEAKKPGSRSRSRSRRRGNKPKKS